jgi:hypothetical protein
MDEEMGCRFTHGKKGVLEGRKRKGSFDNLPLPHIPRNFFIGNNSMKDIHGSHLYKQAPSTDPQPNFVLLSYSRHKKAEK